MTDITGIDMETSSSFNLDDLTAMLDNASEDILELQESSGEDVIDDIVPAVEAATEPKMPKNNYDSLQLSAEYDNQLELYLNDVYGPTSERWVYLYRERLSLIPAEHQPLLVMMDVQFVGNQLTEIAIAHRLQNFLFHRVYPTCHRFTNNSIFNRRFNSHNYRKEKRCNRSAVYRRNMDYVKQYCSCEGKNYHHSKCIFNDDAYFKSLPSGDNVIYVIRGLNKKEYLEMFMQKYNISAAIRTYPLHLTTNHEKYTTCFAHATPQGHCSVGNIIQMINYYNQCEEFIFN